MCVGVERVLKTISYGQGLFYRVKNGTTNSLQYPSFGDEAQTATGIRIASTINIARIYITKFIHHSVTYLSHQNSQCHSPIRQTGSPKARPNRLDSPFRSSSFLSLHREGFLSHLRDPQPTPVRISAFGPTSPIPT